MARAEKQWVFSKYAKFEIDRKFEFLCNLAFVLTSQFNVSVFTSDHLLQAYNEIRKIFNLPRGEAERVVSELETHTGLIVETGYHRYEFAHKSLQEYLAAEYIVKLPGLPIRDGILISMPNELSIAVSISSNPSAYLSYLTSRQFMIRGVDEHFFQAFVARLVIERPDFTGDVDIGLAVLRLYTQHLENYFTMPNLEIFANAILEGQLAELVKLAFHPDSEALSLLKSKYKIIPVERLEGRPAVIKLDHRGGSLSGV